jgi:SAM-dependent methyltransferase
MRVYAYIFGTFFDLFYFLLLAYFYLLTFQFTLYNNIMNYIKEYQKMKNYNWWFLTRNDIIEKMLKKYSLSLNFYNQKILDCGCGRGDLLIYLKKKGFKNLYGIDNTKDMIKNIDDISVFNMDVCNMSFNDEEFDIVISSDLIEHIDDDKKAILEMKRILKKNGVLIVFVPAFNFLWSYHDVINMHKRRYTKKEIVFKLKSEGFEILKSSYWNFLAFFPVFIIRIIKKIFKIRTNDFYSFPLFLNKIIAYFVFVENFLLNYINFPFGVSVFVVARKGG